MNRLGTSPRAAQGSLGLGLHIEHLVFQLLGTVLVGTGGRGRGGVFNATVCRARNRLVAHGYIWLVLVTLRRLSGGLTPHVASRGV